ncbi:RNA polymerase sigma factor [Roseimaritima multifibrata]|uniref:RNA polymerase sigma factor n=1 Tax=Roseimaritima multifibrata TaxID=1930274 RepID=A0A517M988_9BACT|nr:sigma-70 family RNA polymerase sigma factor [Roseimaritima multifibrata]QDS91439.1 RNA polymerase sigma factor [Roseimaritima multifibrata]
MRLNLRRSCEVENISTGIRTPPQGVRESPVSDWREIDNTSDESLSPDPSRTKSFLDSETGRRLHEKYCRIVGEHNAEDVVQSGYVKFLKAEAAWEANGVEPPANLMLYLNRINFNEAIDFTRKSKRLAHPVHLPGWYDCVDGSKSPDETLVHKERVERLHSGMAKLTAHQVELLKQRHLEELTMAQLEACHNVTRKTIYNRLQKVYCILRPIIDGTSHENS